MAALFLMRARPLPTAHTRSAYLQRLSGPAPTSADTHPTLFSVADAHVIRSLAEPPGTTKFQ